MKLTETQIQMIKNHIKTGKNVKVNYSVKCDLCGYKFDAVRKHPTMKSDCPNCENEVYCE